MRPLHRLCGLLLLLSLLFSRASAPPPESGTAPPKVVIFVLADDVGYGSAGWARGSPAATAGPRGGSLTPRLDSLAASGAILDTAISAFWCTPARSSLLTGRLPVHVQMGQDFPETPTAGAPAAMTFLSEKFKARNWSTHAVGKWDVGFASPAQTPEGRGFDSSLVYVEHMNEAWTQQIFPGGTACTLGGVNISDCWADGAPCRGINGTQFIEYMHRDRLQHILAGAAPLAGAPLFIYYAPHIAHYPLQVPRDWLARYDYMGDDEPACNATVPYIYPGADPAVQPYVCRQQGAALMGLLDELVGNLTDEVRARGWWDETLLIFSSDNGAPLDVQEAGSSNEPLRGGKYSSWSGGTVVPAFVGGGYLPPPARGSRVPGMVHIADWLATLCALIGADPADARAAAAGLPAVDSLNVWPLISGASSASPRTEVPIAPSTLISWPWKLLTGLQWWSGYAGAVYPNASSVQDARSLNQWVDCGAGCLFNISADLQERQDLAAQHPDVVAALAERLQLLASGFYTNNETGVDVCPPGTLLCGCWAAVHVWGGAFGPYQH